MHQNFINNAYLLLIEVLTYNLLFGLSELEHMYSSIRFLSRQIVLGTLST